MPCWKPGWPSRRCCGRRCRSASRFSRDGRRARRGCRRCLNSASISTSVPAPVRRPGISQTMCEQVSPPGWGHCPTIDTKRTLCGRSRCAYDSTCHSMVLPQGRHKSPRAPDSLRGRRRAREDFGPPGPAFFRLLTRFHRAPGTRFADMRITNHLAGGFESIPLVVCKWAARLLCAHSLAGRRGRRAGDGRRDDFV